MIASTLLNTDLLTPLGAYLHLRGEARASFLLESVERGRLGRYSLVGCGSRVVSYEDAETAGEPVVGYLSYDFVSKLEPTVPLPEDGRGLPESRFVVADVLVRFDHARGVAEVLAGDPDETTAVLEAEVPRPPRETTTRASTRRLPSRLEYERGVEACKEHIRRGDAFQIVLSQRAERRTAARLRQGSRGARDARRSRPQRSLARVPPRHGDGRAVPRGRTLLAHHAPRLGGHGRARRRRHAVRAPAGMLPRGHRLRCAESARDADHLRARGVPARSVCGRGAVCAARRHARRVHHDPQRRPPRRPRAPAGGSGHRRDSDPAAEHEECLRKLAA